jgi:hypothetical protein
MFRASILASALGALAAAASAAPAPAPPLSALARMPVREVTVFKDGHAFVLHEGRLPVDPSGSVLMDYLPNPVLGTFWPYVSTPQPELTAVTASQRRVQVEYTAIALRELIEGNPGAAVYVTEVSGTPYEAEIVGVPQRSSEELEAVSPPGAGESLPVKGDLVLLKTDRGTKAVAIGRIQDITFRNAPRPKNSVEEFRHLLTMKLDWGERKPEATADVGMVYLQKGIRWIPGYRVALDGAGNAAVRLQGTLINELADLKDVTCNLVVGVPTFAFQGTPDPIGLQQSAARLSTYFQRDSQTAAAFSNSIMTQTAGEMRGGGFGRRPGAEPQPADLGPEVAGSERTEDLFVFTVKHVTLGKGQRMVLPVAEYSLKYQDVFSLELPFGPPREVAGNVTTEQQAELARLLNRPKVMHKIRLKNSGPHPLTTAPALLVRGDRVLAQGLMTHTPVGAETDVPVTAAVDIRVTRSDVEAKRTADATVFRGERLTRIDLEGKIHLHNLRAQAAQLEVTRYLLGQVDGADHEGQTAMIDPLDDDAAAAVRPSWWTSYSWPAWWSRLNGIGRVTWKLRLDPGKEVDLGYRWHYFAP